MITVNTENKLLRSQQNLKKKTLATAVQESNKVDTFLSKQEMISFEQSQ